MIFFIIIKRTLNQSWQMCCTCKNLLGFDRTSGVSPSIPARAKPLSSKTTLPNGLDFLVNFSVWFSSLFSLIYLDLLHKVSNRYRSFYKLPVLGAQTLVFCALSPDLNSREKSGKYFFDFIEAQTTITPPSGQTIEQMAGKLWAISEKFTNSKLPKTSQ